ncbi:activin receptor type-2A isoform X1 [Hydra vulgaris]|uniref:Serine/threonine-protein kinase receptor n=2 Tax=Hydra vulgaris TaxID=6087 RepID=A0ABM4BJH6_HYDVU
MCGCFFKSWAVYYILTVYINRFALLETRINYCIHMDSENKSADCTHPLNCTVTEPCEDEKAPCFTLYIQNLSATNETLLPHSSGCWHQDDTHVVLKDECYLEHQTTMQNFITYICLCTGHLCNKNVIFNQTVMVTKPPIEMATMLQTLKQLKKPPYNYSKFLYIVVPCFGVITIVGILVYMWRKNKIINEAHLPLIGLPPPPSPPIISKHIDLHEIISHGQYGHVWKALYENKLVAVKMMLASEKDSWETERKIYSNYILHHENILNFHAAEKRLENNYIQYWIITEFHQHGSLTDFLTFNIIDLKTLINLSLSIANGLTYLHENMKKPSIAHRDFKSRNVLVKDNFTCCISDFGSSFAFDDNADKEKAKFQVGTKRYMAPEVLEGAIAFRTEAFLCIDIYALGLVLWEILSRCGETQAPIGNYQAPYENIVGLHPSISDMVECVCERKLRPTILPEWTEHPILKEFCETIEECWEMEADARLSAWCVYERLVEQARNLENHLNNDDISQYKFCDSSYSC